MHSKKQICPKNLRPELLLVTPSFSGSRGGIEMVCQMIALGFDRLGYPPTIISLKGSEITEGTFGNIHVLPRPNIWGLLKIYWRSKRVLVIQGTANLGWPAVLFSRRCIVGYHIWDTWKDRSSSMGYLVRRIMNAIVPAVACSEYLSNQIGGGCAYLPNPYNSTRFKLDNNGCREIDVLFVGRLITWKGLDVLIKALSQLSDSGNTLKCAFVGDGPDKLAFQSLAGRAGLTGVSWIDGASSERIADLMNASKILVVPSIWDEPFGLVAIEGLACGCRVIASDCGGLREAVGVHGELYPKGDYSTLAKVLSAVWHKWQPVTALSSQLVDHLAIHTPENVAKTYIKKFSAQKIQH